MTRPDDRFLGKVALVTGAARGQGRSHALGLAEEGADVLALDLCAPVRGVPYAPSTSADLQETVRLVRGTGRRVIAAEVDSRDADAVRDFLASGVAELGRLDIAVANAAICIPQNWDAVTPTTWQDTLDVNVTGTWNCVRSAADHLIDSGGGSIVVTGSTASVKGNPFLLAYTVSKHAVAGLVRGLARELARHRIRVNMVNPGSVDTEMIGPGFRDAFDAAIAQDPGLTAFFAKSLPFDAMPPRAVTDAVLYLASDESRYVTGAFLAVDGGTA